MNPCDRDNPPVQPSNESAEVAKIPQKGGARSKILWSLVFVVIAGLTVWAITMQTGISLPEFFTFVKSMNPWWLLAAALAMVCYVFFEGWAIVSVVKSFGYKKSTLHGLVYSSADIYFSAITPSATGGQPASAFFMMKDKIPGAVVTVALIVNLIMYTFAILIIGVVALLLCPSVFLGFSFTSKLLILVGFTVLAALALSFILILYKSSILLRLGNATLSLLAKLRLIRRVDRKRAKLEQSVLSYKNTVAQLGGKRAMMVKVLILNIIQRASTICVALFVFLASGGAPALSADVWASECLVVLGSNIVPVPGAMGISDYMLIDAFCAIGLTPVQASGLDLLSRSISFYACVIMCGLIMVARLISYQLIQKRNAKKQSSCQCNHQQRKDV